MREEGNFHWRKKDKDEGRRDEDNKYIIKDERNNIFRYLGLLV